MPQRIGVAVLWLDGHLVMQLRDFRSHINDPGQWGFFGGHLDPSEPDERGLRRELREELGWSPARLDALGSFSAGEYCIIGFAGEVDVTFEDLVLGEGHDLGAFTPAEAQSGRLFSRRCNAFFPVTPITRTALSLWCERRP